MSRAIRQEQKRALGEVIVRHTCDGKQVTGDMREERMVYVDKRGHYFIKLLTRNWPVTRVPGTRQFICEFRGRTS